MRLALPLSLAVLLAPSPGRGELAHSAYVWQRADAEAVREAVADAPREVGTLVTLAAEVEVDARGERLVRAPLRADAHRARGKGVGLAVRVHVLPRELMRPGHAPGPVARAVADTMARAKEAGLHPTELQLDFDCPTADLATYASWLPSLRRELGETPLTVTALPAWLRASAFADLARATDGFVLQVHGLDPRRVDHGKLFDRRAAHRAVSLAADVGVPFRVALPTYAYGVVFRDGAVVDVTAEDEDDAPTFRVEPDPTEIAAFVRDLGRSRPREVEGLVWFRLPTSLDRRAWGREALVHVMHGEVPRADVRVEIREADGVATVVVENRGALSASDVEARVSWDGELVASDDLGGTFEPVGPREGVVRVPRVAAGTRREAAWLRAGGVRAVSR